MPAAAARDDADATGNGCVGRDDGSPVAGGETVAGRMGGDNARQELVDEVRRVVDDLSHVHLAVVLRSRASGFAPNSRKEFWCQSASALRQSLQWQL